ncbi:MAG TPA: heterodisulfide reductase-related iron-sulfur binding cluster [Anaerolineae bacterium]
MSDQLTPINSDLARRVQDETGQNVYLCYQCIKCTSGCPVAEFFDWQPNQVMRALQLGQEDIALHAQTPWLCACCQTCTTRCPQGLDVTAIMEFLTREALERGIRPSVPEVDVFNQAFMREVRLWRRAYELGLMAEVKLRTRNITGDLDLGLKLFQKRKLKLLPRPARSPRKPQPVPDAPNAVAYYPGCSLHSTAAEFDTSARAVAQALGLNLIEPKGWTCCGSSAAHRADPDAALRLPLENLSLIEQSGFAEVTMPCAACFNRHKVAQYEIRHDDQRKAALDEAAGYAYRDTVQVSTLIEMITRRVGPQKVASSVKRPLTGLRAVCYYGCLLTRPPQVTEAQHPENPTDMDTLMAALGIEVLDWSYKTTCCGAAHSITRPDIVLKLSGNLIQHAREAGADVIAIACPLCHTNLDARQFQMELAEPLPVLYFTQLMALALGMPEKAALHKNLVDPRPLLRRKSLLEPA